jgi:hypothetical protein
MGTLVRELSRNARQPLLICPPKELLVPVAKSIEVMLRDVWRI